MVNYDLAFKKSFSDMKTLLIGILFSIFPIINFFAMGYIVNLSKRTSEKKLSEFKDFGDLFVKGLLALAISLLYFLPAILLLIVFLFNVAVVLFKSMFFSQMFSQMMMHKVNEDMLAQQLIALAPQMITALPFLIFAGILGLLAMYLIPVAIIGYVSKNKFGDAFDIKVVFRKAFTLKYLGVFCVAMLAYVVLYAVLGWIPWIGAAIASFVGGVFAYTLFGQVYKELR